MYVRPVIVLRPVIALVSCVWACARDCVPVLATVIVLVIVLAPVLVLLVIVPSHVLEPVIVIVLAHPVPPWCKSASTFVIDIPLHIRTQTETSDTSAQI